MKRDLLKQMKNEWRENIWLVLELLIVLLAVWALSWTAFVQVNAYFQPVGFDAENVWYMYIKEMSEESPSYVKYAEDAKSAKNGEDMVAIINRIRRSPSVEAAAFSNNGLPYNFSYIGTAVVPDNGDSIVVNINQRDVSPDMARVLRYESLNGFSPEKMEELLKKGEILIATYPEYDKIRDPKKLLGVPLILGGDSTKRYVSHSLINTVKRSEFEDLAGSGMVINPIDENQIAAGQNSPGVIAVRLKPGTETAFLDEFRTSSDMRGRRNLYLGQPQKLLRTRDTAIRTDLMKLRMVVGGSICLLIMVFLGLLGSFWYRIRRRESEIAIRKVNGATSGDIFRRLITEGILLVTMAMVFAIIFGTLFSMSSKAPDYENFIRDMIIAGVLSLAIILIVVVAGISIPAKIAMKIEPAIALKDE